MYGLDPAACMSIVIPAKTGIQFLILRAPKLDRDFCRGDERGRVKPAERRQQCQP
jgi:hypothetical protein